MDIDTDPAAAAREARLAWSRPTVDDVAPGVHRIPLPLPEDGLRAVNVYALVSRDDLTLIDAGWALSESERALVDGLAHLGAGLGDVTRFLVTHAHRDHYTQAIALRARFGTEVALGRGEQPALDALSGDLAQRERGRIAELHAYGADHLMRKLAAAWRQEDFDTAQWAYPDTWLDADAVVDAAGRRLDALATPGHTRGHVVFRDAAAGLLFAGDHVLPTITPSIGFEPAPAASPLADYLRSLRLLLELPDTVLLPAHGPVAPSVHARVHELLEHHHVRLDQCERAVAAGADTAHDAAALLPWTRRGTAFADLGLFDRMLAVIETGAHLKVLVATGRIAGAADGAGVERYTPG